MGILAVQALDPSKAEAVAVSRSSARWWPEKLIVCCPLLAQDKYDFMLGLEGSGGGSPVQCPIPALRGGQGGDTSVPPWE